MMSERFAVRVALAAALWKKASRNERQTIRRAMRDEAVAEAVVDGLLGAAAGAGVLKVGGPIIDAIRELLDYIIQNWEAIAQIIMFIIGLFLQPLVAEYLATLPEPKRTELTTSLVAQWARAPESTEVTAV